MDNYVITVMLLINVIVVIVSMIKFGVSDPRFILILIYTLYNISYPVDALLYAERVPQYTNELAEVGVIFTLFTCCIFIGAVGSGKISSLSTQQYGRAGLHISSVILFIMSFIFYLAHVYRYWSIAINDRNILYRDPVTSLMLAKIFVCFYFLIVIATWIEHDRFPYGVLFAFIFVVLLELIIFGDRRLVASCLLTAFVIYNYNKKVSFKFRYFICFVFMGIVMLWVETTRYGGNFFDAIAGGAANPAIGELGAPWFVALNIYPEIELFNFSSSSFIESFGVLVPRFIWLDRPLGASEWFVQTYYPEIAAIGGGFAFSFVIEILMNFSVIGLIYFGIFFGFVIGLLAQYKNVYARLLLTCVMFTVLFLPRMDSASLLKSFCICLFLVVLPFVPGIFLPNNIFRYLCGNK